MPIEKSFKARRCSECRAAAPINLGRQSAEGWVCCWCLDGDSCWDCRSCGSRRHPRLGCPVCDRRQELDDAEHEVELEEEEVEEGLEEE